MYRIPDEYTAVTTTGNLTKFQVVKYDDILISRKWCNNEEIKKSLNVKAWYGNGWTLA